MSGQKQKEPFLKNRAAGWRQRFRTQNSGTRQRETLSPEPSNNQEPARSRSPLRFLWRSTNPASPLPGASSPTVSVASTPLVNPGNDPSADAAVPATTTAASAPSTTSGDDPSAKAAPPSNLQSLWEKSLKIAEKKLPEMGLPPLETSKHAHQAASEIVQLTIGDLNTAIQQSNKSVTVQRLQGILKTFNSYAQIVDVAIQHSPEVTALVWAGVRGILQITLNHIETTESLEQFTAIIAEKMAVCDFYASVYTETSSGIMLSATTTPNLQQKLDSALPELYAAIVVFSVKARQYFDPSTSRMMKLGYMFKPFATEFQPLINDISEKERSVRECADMAVMDRIMQHSKRLEQMRNHLRNIESELAPLSKLNKILNNTAKAELRRIRELLQMLSPLESPKRHQDMQSRRVDGTGTWLFNLDHYQQWFDSTAQDASLSDRILCCYGAPGAGKTTICSIVIDDLTSKFVVPDTVGIAYIYCDYRDQGQQTEVNILGSLLKQFLIATSQVPETVVSILESIQHRDRRVERKDISKMLEITLSYFDRNFVCIDALDELDSQVQKGLLETLRSEFSTTRIFLTGRPHIQPAVDTYLAKPQHAVEVTANASDIRAYIDHAIRNDTNQDAMDEGLKADILSAIIEKSQGMFLLPVLHISMVLGQRTKRKRREALKELPVNLDKAFAGMIDRIKLLPSADSELGMRVLMWLHLAYRPLKLDELSDALAVERGDIKLDTDNIPSKKALLECCVGLVTLDEETKTVRFVHYSVEEYFKQHAGTYFPSRYSTAAETCLTYLNFNELASPCTSIDNLKQRMRDFPFLEYAACQWGRYARHEQSNDSVRGLALKLLQHRSNESHCALQALHDSYLQPKYYWICKYSKLFSGIHAAACFGLGLRPKAGRSPPRNTE